MDLSEKIIYRLLKERIKNIDDLNNFKRKISKEYKISLPSNFLLLREYHKLLAKKRIKRIKWFEKIFKIRPTRSLSGIVNISVLTKPFPCPGSCLFCPTEKGFPKSYLSKEPAAERAKILNYNPYAQIKKRIEALKTEGHPTDKIELRIIGGTFSFYPLEYRIWFLKECFRAANESKKNFYYYAKSRKNTINELWKELFIEQKKNEKAKNRIVGISIETRPDFITKEEIRILRNLGVTMVEIGAQTVFDEVLEKNKTGLTSEIISRATKILKDNGFKILYHLMLNLPGSNYKKDLNCFKIVFSDERFLPDWVKIYPLVITQGSVLCKFFKKINFKPYSDKQLIELLINIKKDLPRWVRIARILRDIPAEKIVAGCKISNLREVVKNEMQKRGIFCKCIRCREVKDKYNPKEKIYLFREDFASSGGKEIFLSFENKNRRRLFSYLRLRVPGEKNCSFFKILKNSAIVREIQTFGELVPISKTKIAPQHRGLGKKLINEAEKIAKKEFGLEKIAVIAGIGVREYFRKLGYKLKESYMTKKLK